MPDRPKKKRLWEVDPTIFNRDREASFFERRLAGPLRQVGKFGLFTLAITYPIYLVYIGLAFGGLAFWGFLAGSMAVIGLVITRLGFAANFRHWDIGFRRMAGVSLGFVIAFGFYAGLIYLKTWLIPVALIVTGLGIFIVFRKSRL